MRPESWLGIINADVAAFWRYLLPFSFLIPCPTSNSQWWCNFEENPWWYGTLTDLGHLLPRWLLSSNICWTYLLLSLFFSLLRSPYNFIQTSSDGPKHAQGESPSRKRRFEVSKTVLSTWTFLKVTPQLGNGHGTRDEQKETTNIFKGCYFHINVASSRINVEVIPEQ